MEVTIEQVRKAYEPELLATEGVVGVGHVGDKIRIYVEGSPDFPETIAGYSTEVVKVGHIRALPLLAQEFVSLATDRTSRMRPALGGCSVGHYCYSEDTRVLTKRGLIYFRDLMETDEIATLKAETEELQWQNPIGVFSYDYEGPMIHFEGKTIDLLVTPQHRVYCRSGQRKDKKFKLIEAEKVLSSVHYSTIELKRDCKWNCAELEEFSIPLDQRAINYEKLHDWNGSSKSFSETYGIDDRTVRRWKKGETKPHFFRRPSQFAIDDWLEFLGWYLSEGSLNVSQIVISERSGQYHEEIITLFKRMGLTSCVDMNKDIRVSHIGLVRYFKKLANSGARNKFIPEDIKELAPHHLKKLFIALMKGDGHSKGGRPRHYKTSSWHLANDMLEIGLKCGYGVTIQEYKPTSHQLNGRIISGGTSFRVGFSSVKLTPCLGKKPQIMSYAGKIHCVEVPNHIIFVERKGKTCWSGNSITAGTLSMALDLGGRLYGLSNCHVLANADSVQKPSASVGDEILQPGPYDSGRSPDDVIGRLFSWVPLDQVGENLVDMAIFEPLDQADLSREIIEVGEPTGFGQAYVGERVRKSGRTSGLTTGIVQDIDATITVDYGSFEATFVHQIITSFLADPGDSGSALLDEASPRVIGLLYSGSEFVTCHNQINPVLQALAVGPRALGTFPWRTLSLAPLGALALYLLR